MPVTMGQNSKLSPGSDSRRDSNSWATSPGHGQKRKRESHGASRQEGKPLNGHINGTSKSPGQLSNNSASLGSSGLQNGVSRHPISSPADRRGSLAGHNQSNGTPMGHLKEKARALHNVRITLPIWEHREEIRQGLTDKDVLLLVGETGSGKSTQVPQFLLDTTWCQRQTARIPKGQSGGFENISVGGCIAITQPRRVAAISLARRVADEMGTPLGSASPASKVGYSVRFDNSTSPSTRIKFLTEGMLLQELLRDPWLRQYSAVIVDEIHERGVNVDLVTGFLRNIVTGKKEGRGGIPLKVGVMSATADMEGLLKFFDSGFGSKETVPINGVVGEKIKTKDLSNGTKNPEPETKEESDEDDGSEWSGISDDEGSKQGTEKPLTNGVSPALANKFEGKGTQNEFWATHPAPYKPEKKKAKIDRIGKVPEIEPPNAVASAQSNQKEAQALEKSNFIDPSDLESDHVSVCFIEGRQFPVKVFYAPEPVQDFVDASLRTIFQIHYKEPLPGDILVFLTGQDTVESLEKLVNDYAVGMARDVPKILVLPLFAALPQAAQQRVFQPAPPKTRKIILATNIAETSVTVSGVRHVVDCGKVKIKQFRNRLGLDSLLVKPVSKSAAIQRKGRAGREAPGHCYRLYTEPDYLKLQQANTPEILRCDLSQAILTMKARGVDDILGFPFLDRPPREALEKALLQLYQLGALADDGQISEIGLRIAKLPLTPHLGRVLLAAAEPDMDCLQETIDIISALSVENLFLNLTSEEKKEEAEAARRDLFRREGDHLTLLATVQAYEGEKSDRKSWATKHFVSHRAMQAVMDVRKQLRAQCRQLKLGDAFDDQSPATTPERASLILRCFLKGFAANTARLVPDGSYRTIIGNQTVAIHPSSGLFGRKVEAIMYNEFVFTNKSYARGVSAIQMDWVGEALAP
ncbi:MAG: hypothetical protein M1819_002726 [Sarea resinae]|nr:MAG: hypothetical protein M1819_002726 [Sarea resinae]